MKTKREWLWLSGFLIVIALYAGARLWRLADSCLWFDEIFGVHAASLAWREMLWFVAQDLIHPPLFYVFLKIWILAGGESLFWLRLFPVFFSILGIAPFLLLCRELKFSKTETLTTLLLLAVNGSLIKYSQEVRMYSPLFCFALVSLWLFVRLLNRNDKLTLIALFIANLFLIYTHYFGWFVVASELIAVLLVRRELFLKIGAKCLLLLLSFAPWIWAVFTAAQTNAGFGQNIGWMSKPGLGHLFSLIFSLNEPFYYQQSSAEPANLYLIAVPFALVSLAAIAIAFLKNKDFEIRLLTVFTVTPLVIAFLASWILPYSIWGTRHLIIVFAPFVLLVSRSLIGLQPDMLKAVLGGFLGLLILASGVIHLLRPSPVFIWCGWENLAARARETRSDNESRIIYAFEDLIAYHLWFAARGERRFEIISVKDFPGISEDKAYFLPRGFDEVKIANPKEISGRRFWIAFRDTKWNPNHPLIQELTARGYRTHEPMEFRAQGQTAFLVLVEKE